MTTIYHTCRKIRYRDKLGAKIALSEIQYGRNKRKKIGSRAEKQVYFCRLCQGWHLTSQRKRG